ncbi:hypothetical protein HY251_13825, partial [bacterium]|nr:hypothetical protein [bacterium]
MALSRSVASREARALDQLYGTLLGCARRRVTSEGASPSPIVPTDVEVRLPPGSQILDIVYETTTIAEVMDLADGSSSWSELSYIAYVHADSSGARSLGALEVHDRSAEDAMISGQLDFPLLAEVGSHAVTHTATTPEGAFAVSVDGERGEAQVWFASFSQGCSLPRWHPVGRGTALVAQVS